MVVDDTLTLEKNTDAFMQGDIISITEKIDSVELEFKLETSTEYTNKILERKSPVVVFVDRWYKSQDKIVAYTLSIIPIETIVEKSIDLIEKENLIKFLDK